MLTPLVIAMPQPMAEATGYPGTPFSWADLLRLSTSGEGWAAIGHPEWGPFRLGKTNPNLSTSGLSALRSAADSLSQSATRPRSPAGTPPATP